ncbi:hypothetical protein [Faecalibacterium sp. AM43-5AT]|uniref:hypothetical protein n=1 Tax=Faecalibacterium sp. AM43-5AT TaxID=2302957 RepID=UPI000E772747|nr:hypothetical protein [Faecalibacterium sp. AM43-5AT]RJV94702.1 hypothetical protein DW937_11995 [Faecalibacterium sp. AM43-5AT]
MMMPANFSAVAENEMTYVVGGSLVDVLAPAMTTENWQNVSANVIKIVGNSFLAKYTNDVLSQLFDGNYIPGDVIGYSVKKLDKAYNKGYGTFGGNWGFAVGALNAGMQILGGLSAIYTLGSSSIGLETKSGTLPTL